MCKLVWSHMHNQTRLSLVDAGARLKATCARRRALPGDGDVDNDVPVCKLASLRAASSIMLCLHALPSPTLATHCAASFVIKSVPMGPNMLRHWLQISAAQSPSLTTRRPGPVPYDADMMMLAAAQNPDHRSRSVLFATLSAGCIPLWLGHHAFVVRRCWLGNVQQVATWDSGWGWRAGEGCNSCGGSRARRAGIGTSQLAAGRESVVAVLPLGTRGDENTTVTIRTRAVSV